MYITTAQTIVKRQVEFLNKTDFATFTSHTKDEKEDVKVLPRPPAPRGGGVVYTRWGNSSCADDSDTKLVYHGITGKGYYKHTGGGIDFQCMPYEPESYEDFQVGVGGSAYMYGVEYKNPLIGTHNHNVPCAVCYVPRRASRLMIPAKLSCPKGWTKEYAGYLMSSNHSHASPSTFLCVDRGQESLNGSSDSAWAGALYHVEPICNAQGFPCPPYNRESELTCVVCTK